jgi:hypothetical protein
MDVVGMIEDRLRDAAMKTFPFDVLADPVES